MLPPRACCEAIRLAKIPQQLQTRCQAAIARREYLPADCLRDGEQNDSAEVLELLYSTLASEFAKQASIPSRALQQAQSAWKVLASMLSATSSRHKQPAVHKVIHQDSFNRHDESLPLTSASSSSSSSSFSSSISHQPSTTSSDAKATVRHGSSGSIAEVSCAKVPLQGTTVNDMMCVKCRHSFTTQHAPFLVLPLALPITKVCQMLTSICAWPILTHSGSTAGC